MGGHMTMIANDSRKTHHIFASRTDSINTAFPLYSLFYNIFGFQSVLAQEMPGISQLGSVIICSYTSMN